MAKCPRCGFEVTEGAKFCGECGHSMAGPQTDNEQAHAQDQTMLCARCGAELGNGANFCSECGYSVKKGAKGSPSPPKWEVCEIKSGMTTRKLPRRWLRAWLRGELLGELAGSDRWMTRFEAHRITESGRETIFMSDEVLYEVGIQGARALEMETRYEEARDQVISYLLGEGWEPATYNPAGKITVMRRQLPT